jgi:hypothetical protein
MKIACVLLSALLIALACPAMALESTEFRMRDDFGMEPLYDCRMNYYYYTPCPTYSWFWAFSGWDFYDRIGAFFEVGDISMFTGQACDPVQCHTLDQFRVLDFAGYGTIHPSIGGVIFEIWCSDEYGCPIGPPLWSSGEWWTGYAWNYIPVYPPLCLTGCSAIQGDPPARPRILITASHIGRYNTTYPSWGFDNISTGVEVGCDMHEYSCLPSLYPRPYNSYYPTIHSGFYGQDFEYCPPLWFRDKRDTTPGATQYGYIEMAWRIYLTCSGPTNVEPTTWGNIKSMYR